MAPATIAEKNGGGLIHMTINKNLHIQSVVHIDTHYGAVVLKGSSTRLRAFSELTWDLEGHRSETFGNHMQGHTISCIQRMTNHYGCRCIAMHISLSDHEDLVLCICKLGVSIHCTYLKLQLHLLKHIIWMETSCIPYEGVSSIHTFCMDFTFS